MSSPVNRDCLRRIRSAFSERFLDVAYRGLESMLVEDDTTFCFRAFAGQGPGLALDGRSSRYAAMSLIGLASQSRLGRESRCPTDKVSDHLAEWGPKAAELGDSGLVLWSQILNGDERAEQLVKTILLRKDEVFAPGFDFPSMEMGFLLIGLSEAIRAGVAGDPARVFASDLAARLKENQHPASQLFSFGRKVRRKNIHRVRMDSRLGSFASQVYPTMGFAAYSRATGCSESLDVAVRCTRRLCELQGPQGQWWWVYQTRRPAVAVRYPVYTVHQDAMGPMALLATAIAGGCTDRYDAAVLRSLQWFDDRPECPEDELVDERHGLVLRAVQRDDPAATGRLGLGRRELSRLGRSAWLGTEDRRPLKGGVACPECRPYHLGWILLAAALLEECADGR